MRLASLALLAACGRVGFEDLATSDGQPRPDAPACPTCDQGLVAHWKLDEQTGTLAHDTAGGHDGTLVRGSFVPDGAALQGGYVESMWDLTAAAPDAFAIAMRVNVDPAANDYDRYFASFWYELDNTYRGAIYLDNNTRDGLRCQPDIGGTFAYVESFGTVSFGAWHEIACMYDGAQLAIFVDGQSVAAMAASGTFQNTAVLPVAIGASLDETSNSQNESSMRVADVRVYNRALAPAELAALNP